MKNRPTAARGTFPYISHRTLAEIDAEFEFLRAAAERIERANQTRLLNTAERGTLRAFRRLAA